MKAKDALAISGRRSDFDVEIYYEDIQPRRLLNLLLVQLLLFLVIMLLFVVYAHGTTTVLSLTGTLRDGYGTAVEGAYVLVSNGSTYSETYTDTAGRYTLQQIGRASCRERG